MSSVNSYVCTDVTKWPSNMCWHIPDKFRNTYDPGGNSNLKDGGLIESEYQIFFNNKSCFTLYDYFSHTIQIFSEVNR